jgi:type I restriction enzyme R subunit
MPAVPHPEPEWLTRKQRIDRRLAQLDWTVTPFEPACPVGAYTRHAVTEYPTEAGPADYAFFVDGVALGIVEAEKLSLGPQNALVQAERYARGATANSLDFRGYRVPFLYSTNGEVIWHHDIRHPLNLSRRVAGLPTPAALAELMGRDFDAALLERIRAQRASPAQGELFSNQRRGRRRRA